MTFILFFAFVINTGMLVNAKINLQNATDLAAYAGAAVQARQLTHISYLNYEMRRQWKKLLFRIYVLGNMAQDSFQDAMQGKVGPMDYYPNRNNPSTQYGVPSTCIVFNQADNFCHLSTLPKILIPPETFIDAISDTLRSQLQDIEKIRQNNCKGIGLTNLMVNLYWLYNTDPDLVNSTNNDGSGLSLEQMNTLKLVQSITRGLGIVPRELILKYRIETLASYINSQNQTGVSLDTVTALQQTLDPATYERTIQAFYSAYYTLGNHIFPTESITLDELLPSATDGSMMVLLKPIQQAFDTWSINPIVGSVGADGSGDCQSQMNPISVPNTNKLTVGFYKDPSILTYYAIRVKAKAKILFSPFGDIELKAYAAAQPFGSRIGPKLPENAFASIANPPGYTFQPGANGVAGLIPNLPIKLTDGDTPSMSTGWNTMEVLAAMYQGLKGEGTQSNPILQGSLQSAYDLAMAPNPYEANKYNIINDISLDPFIRNFGTDQFAAFWAPVFSANLNQSVITSKLQQDINYLFTINAASGSAGGATSTSSSVLENVKQSILTGLNLYIEKLRQGAGEDQEGMDVARLKNPFTPFSNQNTKILGNTQFFLTDSSLLQSSWNSVSDSRYRSKGKVGYSVKFISFDTLTVHPLSTTGSGLGTWTNKMQTDSEADGDIPYVKH